MINYVTGDATQPIGDGNKIIMHIVNDIGCWGAGFVCALSKRWDKPEQRYKQSSDAGLMTLGKLQAVQVEPHVCVANMVAQHMVGKDENGEAPIRYDALITCLRKLRKFAREMTNASVHAPFIGAGLAGGRWEIIEPIIETELCERGIPVTVYKFEE